MIIRRQGTGTGGETREGKLLVLKKRFKNKNSLDIWSSLLLSLDLEEIEFIAQGHKQEETESAEEIFEEDPPVIEVEFTEESPVLSESDDVFDKKLTIGKSVRDLSRTFDGFANSSSVSLLDHVKSPEQVGLKVTILAIHKLSFFSYSCCCRGTCLI